MTIGDVHRLIYPAVVDARKIINGALVAMDVLESKTKSKKKLKDIEKMRENAKSRLDFSEQTVDKVLKGLHQIALALHDNSIPMDWQKQYYGEG